MNKNNKKQTLNVDLHNEETRQKIAENVLFLMKEKGMTLQEATGISDETLEEIYSLAYGYYNQGKYKESLALFHLLAGSSPTTYKYVLGAAASNYQLGLYEEAALGFFCSLHLNAKDPMPAYYIADCFLQQNLLEEAMEFAKATIILCEDRPEYDSLKARCELIIKNISK